MESTNEVREPYQDEELERVLEETDAVYARGRAESSHALLQEARRQYGYAVACWPLDWRAWIRQIECMAFDCALAMQERFEPIKVRSCLNDIAKHKNGAMKIIKDPEGLAALEKVVEEASGKLRSLSAERK